MRPPLLLAAALVLTLAACTPAQPTPSPSPSAPVMSGAARDFTKQGSIRAGIEALGLTGERLVSVDADATWLSVTYESGGRYVTRSLPAVTGEQSRTVPDFAETQGTFSLSQVDGDVVSQLLGRTPGARVSVLAAPGAGPYLQQVMGATTTTLTASGLPYPTLSFQTRDGISTGIAELRAAADSSRARTVGICADRVQGTFARSTGDVSVHRLAAAPAVRSREVLMVTATPFDVSLLDPAVVVSVRDRLQAAGRLDATGCIVAETIKGATLLRFPSNPLVYTDLAGAEVREP